MPQRDARRRHHPRIGAADPRRRRRAWSHLTLTTTRGDIDLLGEITGGGGYDDLRAHAHVVRVFDRDVLCLDLPMLIRVRRAAGRPRDLEALAELEVIADELDR